MADVASWLGTLGLERYASAFAAAEIELDTVPHLSDDDLKELGLPLGPRRRILAAQADCPDPATATDVETPTAPERRHLTVMFVDIVGSTGMSVRFDPEALGEVLTRYKALVAEEVAHGTGTVAKYLGDGVLAYFGWPQAREDAAECAIRCALQVLERVRALRDPGGAPLACRIGIATGLVVVGGATGSGNAREDSVAGEVLNLAARIQSLADPDSVLIAESTHRQVGQLFECADGGAREVKGFDAPVQVWRALRPAPHTNRFAAVRSIRTALIGRDDELAMLGGRWQKTLAGEGRGILIQGEAGIGKSRLSEALHAQIAAAPHAYVGWQCSAFHQSKALYPVIEHLTREAAIGEDDPPAARLTKLAALLAATGPAGDAALPLFAELLSIPPAAGYAPAELAPAQRRAATIEALAEWIARIAARQPLLLLLEDAHWIDATTLDLLTALINRIDRLRMLAVVTARPSFVPPWVGHRQVGTIGLDRLSRAECETIVREIAAADPLRGALVDEIVVKADGNPLFLEELSIATLDAPVSGGQSVPDSLQSSLMARLDQLGAAKELAQMCSVLGRRFARPLLARIVGTGEPTLDGNLARLVESDILYPIQSSGEPRYEFKHALVRDIAYDSLLKSRRRQLHCLCGTTLRGEFPDTERQEPELLAWHFAQAGMADEACDYFERAGDRAAALWSFVEAMANYQAALSELATTESTPARDRRQLDLLLKLGPAQAIIVGPQAPEMRETYAAAEPLARTLGDADARFKATWGQWFHTNLSRAFADAACHAEELIAQAEATGDEGHRLEALHCRWSSGMFRGEYAGAVDDADEGVALYDRDRHHVLGLTFGGHDPGVCAYTVRGAMMAMMGDAAGGVASTDAAVALAEQLDHPHSIAHALTTALLAAVIAGDHALVRQHADQLCAVSDKFNFPPQGAVGQFFRAWVEIEAGDPAAGLELMRSAYPRVVRIGAMPVAYTALHAEQLVRLGSAAEALALIDDLLADPRIAETGLYLTELHRVRGDAQAALDQPAAARASYDLALELLDQRDSPLFRARTLASRERLVA